ncbi:MAG: hypothetical protein PVG14_10130 [Anaerolineales bacterium]|jgi:beta-lactamase superfamily II metal-dependent hydrolase
MANKLLVRAYNVGVGDCIYVHIPNGDDGFHILIDCGTISRVDLLKNALKNLEDEMLPDADEADKKRLDLLVATHRHRDHIKGFDPEYFENIQIKNIWLSAAMDREHPQAEQANALHAAATSAMREIEARGLALSLPLQLLVSMYSLQNDEAMKALREDLPQANGIEPVYVHADTPQNELSLPLTNATIRVLAPEKDIDGYYLGEEMDESLHAFQANQRTFTRRSTSVNEVFPGNISASDFHRLQSRMLSNALAFAETDSSLQNNTSVVLLIEWQGRRLLFTGDAEWEGEFKEGKHNGNWNVMWKERTQHLREALDFLKIGHHGSINATPWDASREPDFEVNQILNHILPLPEGTQSPKAYALASTQRTAVYKPIPAADLLVELGKRVRNTREYFDELSAIDLDFADKQPFEDYWEYETPQALKQPQPWRTDLEKLITGQAFVDVEIEPMD